MLWNTVATATCDSSTWNVASPNWDMLWSVRYMADFENSVSKEVNPQFLKCQIHVEVIAFWIWWIKILPIFYFLMWQLENIKYICGSHISVDIAEPSNFIPFLVKLLQYLGDLWIYFNRLFHVVSGGFREQRFVVLVKFVFVKWENGPKEITSHHSSSTKLRDKIYSDEEPKYWFNTNSLFEFTWLMES